MEKKESDRKCYVEIKYIQQLASIWIFPAENFDEYITYTSWNFMNARSYCKDTRLSWLQ